MQFCSCCVSARGWLPWSASPCFAVGGLIEERVNLASEGCSGCLVGQDVGSSQAQSHRASARESALVVAADPPRPVLLQREHHRHQVTSRVLNPISSLQVGQLRLAAQLHNPPFEPGLAGSLGRPGAGSQNVATPAGSQVATKRTGLLFLSPIAPSLQNIISRPLLNCKHIMCAPSDGRSCLKSVGG